MDGFAVLSQFVFRLSLGLAVGMALTPPRLVTGGYYRNHLYVLLGLNVLAALATVSQPERLNVWLPAAAALTAYLGAVFWMLNKAGPGLLTLWLIAGLSLAAAWQNVAATFDKSTETEVSTIAHTLAYADAPTSGLVLGITIAAMFLGHWYLNAPGMRIAPLQRLVVLMAAVVVIRAGVSGSGLAMTIVEHGVPPIREQLMIGLRWLSGIVGAGLIAAMTWHTLRIPNTQAATGMLYVGVIATFLGELTSQLLSQGKPFPL